MEVLDPTGCHARVFHRDRDTAAHPCDERCQEWLPEKRSRSSHRWCLCANGATYSILANHSAHGALY